MSAHSLRFGCDGVWLLSRNLVQFCAYLPVRELWIGRGRFLNRRLRREQLSKGFSEGWMSEDGVAQRSVRHPGDHGDLNGGHNFTRVEAKCGKAENAITADLDQCLQ